MGYRINPAFLGELEQYGAKDIRACFNCGNCTAVCPHSKGADTFPRRLIRYGQLGLKEPILGSRELWTCYYCGECSETCPREAEPGEFMAAARRYTIARNDHSGITHLLYTSRVGSIALFVVVSLLLGMLLLRDSGSISGRFFEFLAGHTVHDVGIGVMIVAIVAIVSGSATMIRRVSTTAKLTGLRGDQASPDNKFLRAVSAVIAEISSQKRYRECNSDYSKPEPWLVSRWFVHGSMVWGFIGLVFATTWDFLDKLPDGAAVPLTYAPRLVGTIAAAFFLYGSTVALIQRLTKSNKYAEYSHFSDWVLNIYMFALAVTGVILLALAYLAPATVLGNVILLAHAILAFELILLVPFSKFAHIIYRTIAVFWHAYQGTSPGIMTEEHAQAA